MRRAPHHRRRSRLRVNPAVVTLIILVLAALAFDWWLLFDRVQAPPSYSVVYNAPPTASATPAPSAGPSGAPAASPTATPAPTPLPPSALINVPFQVQAPFANWDHLHEETCEEASLLMVHHYLKGTPITSQDTADAELKDMVAWEGANGFDESITAAQLKDVAARYYGDATGRVVTDPSVDDIKREIANGRPVIVPADGQILKNPYFTPPGPPYHMLVIKGYDAQGFITNDPGIKQGGGFRYTYDNMMSAIHDWTGSNDTILQGQKAYLVFD